MAYFYLSKQSPFSAGAVVLTPLNKTRAEFPPIRAFKLNLIAPFGKVSVAENVLIIGSAPN